MMPWIRARIRAALTPNQTRRFGAKCQFGHAHITLFGAKTHDDRNCSYVRGQVKFLAPKRTWPRSQVTYC